ncbi:hypothetical protein L484_026901 [Morus notabilis]|uniref:Uncharacterized protein n=1 Tax=Morus notabilis TaxID=981085 RepID=W9R949_9ROSA|nr:hypothetical protein L484_026901 [Morus notabilis]
MTRNPHEISGFGFIINRYGSKSGRTALAIIFLANKLDRSSTSRCDGGRKRWRTGKISPEVPRERSNRVETTLIASRDILRVTFGVATPSPSTASEAATTVVAGMPG